MGGFNPVGALGGATSGAQMGSVFGPWGTAIGAGLGAAGGGMEQQPGGGPIQGSPADLPREFQGDITPPDSFAPPPMQSRLKAPGSEMSLLVRDHLLKQLRQG